MTVIVENFWETFTCDGRKDYFFSFAINSAEEMIVSHTDKYGDKYELTYGTDYNVSPSLPYSYKNGGIISLINTAYTSGTLYCIRNTTINQLADYLGSGLLPPQEIQNSFDKITEIAQELAKSSVVEGDAKSLDGIVADILNAIVPSVLVIENVKGVKTIKSRNLLQIINDFEEIVEELQDDEDEILKDKDEDEILKDKDKDEELQINAENINRIIKETLREIDNEQERIKK